VSILRCDGSWLKDSSRQHPVASESTDSITSPALRIPREEHMGAGYSYVPSQSSEAFPEAHPSTGIRREPSSAVSMDPHYGNASPLEHADFPVPAPSGGLRVDLRRSVQGMPTSLSGLQQPNESMSPTSTLTSLRGQRGVSLQDPGYVTVTRQ